MIELTEWAREIVTKSQAAAARFNPSARIRLARVGREVRAELTDQPSAEDQVVSVGLVELYVESGLEGLLDVEEPHDRLVLRPLGSVPNARGH
jgi:hypothetical protein